MCADTPSLVDIRSLTLDFPAPDGFVRALDNVSLSIKAGEKVAIIGESGSGKTLMAKAVIDLLPAGCICTAGTISWRGQPLGAGGLAQSTLRGREIAYIFQEPLSSLNPSLKIGIQMIEAQAFHRGLSHVQCRAAAVEMLQKVKIENAEQILNRYPHELSGGMRQRVMIASSLMLKPALLIADEPTTALDMAVRQDIMELITGLADEVGAAVLMISHDIGTIAKVADSVHVFKQGRLVESGNVAGLLAGAQDSYTRRLLAAVPQPRNTTESSPSTPLGSAPLLKVKNLSVEFRQQKFLRRATDRVRALDNISLTIECGETLAIIGESGSGKTTLSRAVAGLQHPSNDGIVEFNWPKGRSADIGRLQFIFQDPASALNPRMRVVDAIAESLHHQRISRRDKNRLVDRLLERVGLASELGSRFPHELSGGQRQRVCIARALAPEPAFIIADEPVAALDVTVQRQILDLFGELKESYGFACLFISHDLGIVEHIADRVGVLREGRLVETGSVSEIFGSPKHTYTRALLAATPCLVASHDADATSYRLTNRLNAQPELNHAPDC